MTTKVLRNPFRQHGWTWLLALFSGAWLAASIIFSWALSSTTSLTAFVPNGFSLSALLLRILSEGVAVTLTVLVSCTLDALSWSAVNRNGGSALPTFLAINSSTRIKGMARLLMWKTGQNSVARGWHILWVLLRYCSRASVYILTHQFPVFWVY